LNERDHQKLSDCVIQKNKVSSKLQLHCSNFDKENWAEKCDGQEDIFSIYVHW